MSKVQPRVTGERDFDNRLSLSLTAPLIVVHLPRAYARGFILPPAIAGWKPSLFPWFMIPEELNAKTKRIRQIKENVFDPQK